MDALGVGIIYFPGLEAILKAGEDLIDVVEFEPATIWYKRSDGHFHINQQALKFIADLPFHKLIHGVGFPVAVCKNANTIYNAGLVIYRFLLHLL